MSRWKVYAWPREIPAIAGVYAIYFDGDLVYIGQSVNVRNRWCEHQIRLGYAKNIITPWGDIPDKTVVTFKVSASRRYGDWAMRELRLIRRLKPLFNIQGKGRKLRIAA